jgi:WS/DGAT/MGAT family acyltransferase
MPGQLSMLGRGLLGVPRQPVRMIHALPRTLPHLDEVPTLRSLPGIKRAAAISRRIGRTRPRTRTRDGGVLEGGSLRAPRTPINQPIGPHRRVALSHQSLSEVKLIKDHFGVTVNDVVVTICSRALGAWLQQRGELPSTPLVSLIPVSVRTPEQAGTFGNRVSAMIIALPTTEADPKRQLELAHEALRSAKEAHKAVPVTTMQDANHVIPPFLFARAARVSMMVAARHPSEAPVNTVVSNVPGSPVPQFFAGARQEAMYPVSAIFDGVGLNFTVMSYCGSLDFGVVVDRDLVDDPWPIAEALRLAQADLLALVPAPRRAVVAP